MKKSNSIMVRGGGDIASGTIHRLHRCGYRVLVVEDEKPTAIRRTVSFSEAVYQGSTSIEGVEAKLIRSLAECPEVWKMGQVAVLVDPQAVSVQEITPLVVVDAILAKKNLGTTLGMAPLTIGLGPGFYGGRDVDVVIETARGHNLGRLIYEGEASANSGIPGEISGYSSDRVIYAKEAGILHARVDIGELVTKGEPLAMVAGSTVRAPISGLVRGMIRDNFTVSPGLKICDIDPRLNQVDNCNTISDKARCISGGVLEAIVHFYSEQNQYILPVMGLPDERSRR
jgi:xanthine dehydrogenase accessory factor